MAAVRSRFDPNDDGADVGTATAFLLLPALILLVGGILLVGMGGFFGRGGEARASVTPRGAGVVTVDARTNASTTGRAAVKVPLQPGSYTVSVEGGGFSPWGAVNRPADEGWFWVLQMEADGKHYELGDSVPAADAAGAFAAHKGQTVRIDIGSGAELALWVTDASPDDNEGALSVRIEPVARR